MGLTEVKPTITIHYCALCQWQLRSVWMAQEILATFSEDITAVSLKPGSGGVFEIWVDEQLIWERKRDGGFPDIQQLKQGVRDQVNPEKSLGHIDGSKEVNKNKVE